MALYHSELMRQSRQSLQISPSSETSTFCEFNMLHPPILSRVTEISLLLSGYNLILSVFPVVLVSLCVYFLIYFHLGN